MQAQSIKQMLAKGKGRLKKINERWKPQAGTVQAFVESIQLATNDKRELVATWKLHIQTGVDKGKSFNHNMLILYPEDHDYNEKELAQRNKKIKTSMQNLAIFGIDEDSIDRDLIEDQAGSTIEMTFWKPDPAKMDDEGKRWWANAWPPLYMNEVIEGPQEEAETETTPEEVEEVVEEKPVAKKVVGKKKPATKPKPKAEVSVEPVPAEEPEYEDNDEYEEVE